MAEIDPSRFLQPGGELRLSNQAQLELLRAVVERGSTLRTEVRGTSMTPFIRDRDVVLVAPLAGPPKLGDVVAFMTPDAQRLAIHRVIGRTDEGWLIRGDNCSDADGVVTAGCMLGRVVRVERHGRSVYLGHGPEAAGLAWLSRRGLLFYSRRVAHAPRHAAAAVLHRAQGCALYRRTARHVVSGWRIERADATLPHGLRGSLALLLGQEGVHETAPDMDITTWVSVRRGSILGFVQLQHMREPGPAWQGYWLSSLTVRTRYRGGGLGEALARTVIEGARDAGASQLLLAVYPDNRPACSLYRKLGFQPTVVQALEPAFEEEKRVYARRRIVLVKQLTAGPA